MMPQVVIVLDHDAVFGSIDLAVDYTYINDLVSFLCQNTLNQECD